MITGPAQHNPMMVYLTGTVHVTQADLIKKKGADPVLFHISMERGEAEKTGLRLIDYSQFSMRDILKESNGDNVKASGILYQKMLESVGIKSGRIALYGQVEIGKKFATFTSLQNSNPDIEIVGYRENDTMLAAMVSKDGQEISRIRKMGDITTKIVGKVADYLSSHSAHNNVLINPNGEPITIGNVKRLIDLWLLEEGAENPEGTIFSSGKDSGIPHSSGNPTEVLHLGQTIVFDIFPCEVGGGYYYDFTRTWCLGYAPDDVLAIYENVNNVYQQVVSNLKSNHLYGESQSLACDLFERQGHPTIRNSPNTKDGYVHTIGHGVGLHVHEWPVCGNSHVKGDSLLPGSVFTIEPGLYYPNRNLGVRIEDTYFVSPAGRIEAFAEYSMDLIIPIKK
jgi:Xaa-Pro aminopeptidase